MKYPALIMGIIMFTIFLSQETTQQWWRKWSRSRIPSTCDVILERLEPKAPKDWAMQCPSTKKLIINVEYSPKSKFVRKELYKFLANQLALIGKISNPETLANLSMLEFHLTDTELYKIIAYTDGEALVELSQKSDQIGIMKQLQLSVKISEQKIK